MNKVVKWVSVAAVSGIILYFIWPYTNNSDKIEGSAPVSGISRKIPVSGIIIQTKKMDDKIMVTGSISSNESVELKTEVSGKIERIYFKEGSWVNKGDLLVSLNNDELSAQKEKLKYEQKLYKESEFRQNKLLEREAISQEEYDIALTELNTAGADIKVLEAQLAKTVINAPFSGFIGLRYLSEGSYVTPDDPIASLYNNDPIKIDFSIPGKYSAKVNVNDTIRFITEALEEYRIGRIYAIEPQVDPGTRTLRIRAVSKNINNTLLPGQFTKIELIFSSRQNAIMVPSEALIPELGGYKVYVQKEGKAKAVNVKIGLRTESEVEVISGLAEQDTLITSGILQLRPGADVMISLTN